MRLIVLVCAILMSTPVVAQTPAPHPSGYGSPIAVNDALTLIERGMEQSAAQGLNMAFAVVEPSGELVVFARMDDVAYGAIQLAQQKARTSARYRVTTASREEQVQSGRLAILTADDMTTIGGGVPIIRDGRVIGALGVSGGTAAEDAAIASATVAPR